MNKLVTISELAKILNFIPSLMSKNTSLLDIGKKNLTN